MRLIVSPLSGGIASKIGSTAKVMRIAMLVCAASIIGVLALKPGMPGVVTIATILTFVVGMFVFVGQGPQWACLDDGHIPMEVMGSAVFIASTAATGINDGIMPLIAGYFLDNYQGNLAVGFRYYYGIVLAMIALGIFCTFALQRIDKKWKIQHADELKEIAEHSASAAE